MEKKNYNRGIRSILLRRTSIGTLGMTLLLLIGLIGMQIGVGRSYAEKTLDSMYNQIGEILHTNRDEYEISVANFNRSCIEEAHQLALILHYNPGVISGRKSDELQKIIEYSEAEEINIFDESGTVVFGNNPARFGKSFESESEFNDFLPMLSDRDQEIVSTGNGYNENGEQLLYAAVWSEDKSYILQTGINAEKTVLSEMEKYSLQRVFSRMTRSEGMTMFAMADNGEDVLASTDPWMIEKSITETGLRPLGKGEDSSRKYLAFLHDNLSYVLIGKVDKTIVGCALSLEEVFKDIIKASLYYFVSMLLVISVMFFVFSKFINEFVIQNIDDINTELQRIADGDLGARVDIRSSREFFNLSRFLNHMIQAMLENRRQIEMERDTDVLTGLYNRRGLENEIHRVREQIGALDRCALVLIDMDRLKQTNDSFGHQSGDLYLKKLAEILQKTGGENCISARLGGDEFVQFLYGYTTEEALSETIAKIEACQEGIRVSLSDGIETEISFSMGVSINTGESLDIEAMIKEADAKMYENKRARKGHDER